MGVVSSLAARLLGVSPIQIVRQDAVLDFLLLVEDATYIDATWYPDLTIN